MDLLGFTLDNLSMMALILSIGFVVDDAIVMLENIVRHVEHGESPLEAALKGSKEIGFTIVSMTVSLAAVFIPILFMSGILGRLFREFADHHHRGDSHFRRRVGDADADAVQPLSERVRAAQARDASRGAMERVFHVACSASTSASLGARASAPAGDARWCSPPCSRRPSGCS